MRLDLTRCHFLITFFLNAPCTPEIYTLSLHDALPISIEPEWRGKITLEISNTTPLPAKIYANEGIAQLIFLKGERTCAVSYADRSEEHTSELQSRENLVCRLLLEKKKTENTTTKITKV